MATIVDSYSETNKDTGVYEYSPGKIGQSFTGVAGNITSCKFYLQKVGSPTHNLYAVLYAHSGTFGTSSVPTGAALATSDAVDASSLPASFGLVTFTFSSTYAMSAATKYVISLEPDGGDVSNQMQVGTDGSSPSHAGNECSYSGSKESACFARP